MVGVVCVRACSPQRLRAIGGDSQVLVLGHESTMAVESSSIPDTHLPASLASHLQVAPHSGQKEELKQRTARAREESPPCV